MIYSKETSNNDEFTPMSFQEYDLSRPLPLLEETALLAAQRMSDSAGQLLANTIFELAACVQIMDESPDVAREGLIALEDELRVGLRKLRQFVFELNPPFLHKVGLIAALERYVDRLAKHADVTIETNLDAESRRALRTDGKVPKAYEIAIFRIIQEALYSAVRREHVTDVRITFQLDDAHLEFVIEDDGRWVDPSTVAADSLLGLSHTSMDVRTRIIGGRLDVDPRPGGGTYTRLRAPWAASAS